MVGITTRTYASQAAGSHIVVKVNGLFYTYKLLSMGFSKVDSNGECRIKVSDDFEKAALFEKLRKIDVAFMGGGGWSPSEVFEYLR